MPDESQQGPDVDQPPGEPLDSGFEFRPTRTVRQGRLSPEALGRVIEKMDSVDDLRRLFPSDVQEVRFYEPQLANTHFARYNNAGGAIAVVLKKVEGSN